MECLVHIACFLFLFNFTFYSFLYVGVFSCLKLHWWLIFINEIFIDFEENENKWCLISEMIRKKNIYSLNFHHFLLLNKLMHLLYVKIIKNIYSNWRNYWVLIWFNCSIWFEVFGCSLFLFAVIKNDYYWPKFWNFSISWIYENN